ncbi:hypothetical protein ACE6H2_010489 [Prunus campanulata]
MATTSLPHRHHHTPPLGAASVPKGPPPFPLLVPVHQRPDQLLVSPETATKQAVLDRNFRNFGSLVLPQFSTKLDE